MHSKVCQAIQLSLRLRGDKVHSTTGHDGPKGN